MGLLKQHALWTAWICERVACHLCSLNIRLALILILSKVTLWSPPRAIVSKPSSPASLALCWKWSRLTFNLCAPQTGPDTLMTHAYGWDFTDNQLGKYDERRTAGIGAQTDRQTDRRSLCLTHARFRNLCLSNLWRFAAIPVILKVERMSLGSWTSLVLSKR